MDIYVCVMERQLKTATYAQKFKGLLSRSLAIAFPRIGPLSKLGKLMHDSCMIHERPRDLGLDVDNG